MKPEANPLVIYWDASAVLSALFKDEHSREAYKWARQDGYHFLSTLAYAEVQAVLRRIERERMMADIFLKAVQESLETGPWRIWQGVPRKEILNKASERFPLRGADLWHLGAAVTLREDLPELKLLTYDRRLWIGAQGEGMEIDPMP